MSSEHQKPSNHEAYEAAETYRELVQKSKAAPEEQRYVYLSKLVGAHMLRLAAEQDPGGVLEDGVTTFAERNQDVQHDLREFEDRWVYNDPDGL